MTITANIDIGQLRQACGLLKVPANPDRLLLCQATQGEYCAGEPEETTGIRQPTLAQRPTVVRDEDMVTTRREGKRICCRIASREALAVTTMFHALHCAPEREKEEAS